MRNALVVFRKELLSHCVSPVSWLIAVLFYLWRGYEVGEVVRRFHVFRIDQELLPPSTYGLPSTMVMVILVPGLLTMRTFAEERRTGSIESLMTAPVRDIDVVLGKWLAATAFFALLWLPSIVILHALEYGPFLAADLSFGPVLGAYFGMFLISGMLLAFGCFASSLTDNVMLAAVKTIVFCFALLQLPAQIGASLGELGQNYYVRELLAKLDVAASLRDWFARGLVDTSQVAFYLGGIVCFLGLTTISLASRRIA
jgi:ABC-2 type transport system permease protein